MRGAPRQDDRHSQQDANGHSFWHSFTSLTLRALAAGITPAALYRSRIVRVKQSARGLNTAPPRSGDGMHAEAVARGVHRALLAHPATRADGTEMARSAVDVVEVMHGTVGNLG